MKPNKSKTNRIASAVSLALIPMALYAPLTNAAESTSKAKEAAQKQKEIEIIEIKSYGESITNALNTKRGNNSVMDAITADDIGSFPDDNVAESLQRIPGVSITRSLAGEGESISIRGFSPGKNLSLINGQQYSSSAFNFENALSRGFNYSILPATITKRAEVFKSSEARFPEGGVGGTTNIVTRKPLMQKQETLFVTSGSVGYNSLADEYNPKLSGLGSWKITEQFGLLASIDYSDKDTRRDSNTVLTYRPNTFTTEDGTTYQNVLVPGSIGSAVFQQNLKRKTAMVTAQYQLNDSLDMSLNYLRSDVEGHNLNLALFSRNHTFKHTGGKAVDVLDAHVFGAEAVAGQANTFTGGTASFIEYGSNGAAGQVTASFRDTELYNESVTFDMTYLGDEVTIKGAIGFSESTGGPGDVNAFRINVAGKSSVSIEDGRGFTRFHDTDVSDLASAETAGQGGGHILSTNENAYLTLDAEYFLDDGVITSILFGARFTDARQDNRHSIKGSDYNLVIKDENGNVIRDKLQGVQPASFFGQLHDFPSDLHDSLGGNAYSDIQYIDPRDIDFDALMITNTFRAHAGNSFELKEQTQALYVQANFEQEFESILLRGNFGVRAVNQDTETYNFDNQLNWKNADDLEVLNAFAYNVKGTGGSDYVLPSFNLAAELPNDFVIRTAASKVIARPAFKQLAQQLNLSALQGDDLAEDGPVRQARKGNPDLKAFEANKYDLSFEWYYEEGSAISLGLFYYDVETFVANEESIETYTFEGTEEDWLVSQPTNQDGGELTGVEASLSHQFNTLPAPFDGMGVQLNYTYIDSETKALSPIDDSPLPLPGLSKETINAVLFYSKDNWNARIAYNYRDDYYEQLQWDLPRFSDEIKRLSAKVKYKFDNGLSVYIQGSNLTDNIDQRYIGDPSRPMRSGIGGRNFALGFNYSF